MKPKALFALADAEAGVPLAHHLIGLGWEIIATANMHGVFREHDLAVTDVADFVGLDDIYPFPPTLHPKMELALTGDDVEEPIDLVFDQTYDLDVGLDIGGHTLIGLGIKGGRWVLTNQDDVDIFLSTLDAGQDERQRQKQRLLKRAADKLALFYQSVASSVGGRAELENGENPYQVPAYLDTTDDDDALGIGQFERFSDAKPCFTNIADLDSISHIMSLLSSAFHKNIGKTPHIAIAAKHGNACGIGVSWDEPSAAMEAALWGNPLAVWGGELIVNFALNDDLAQLCIASVNREQQFANANWMLDVVAAPKIEEGACAKLLKRANRKVFVNPALANAHEFGFKPNQRHLRGGVMRQPALDFIPELPDDLCDPRKAVDHLIAWAAAFGSFAGGNEVALAKSNRLLAVDGGPSTVDAAKVAVWRAQDNGHDLSGAVFAADAFFPFTDAPEVLVNAGCTQGSVPGGGQRFADVQAFFDDAKVRCLYWPEAFRGFVRH